MTEPSPTPSTGNTFIPGAKPLENKPLENNPPPSTGIVPETQAIANQKATPPAVVGKAEPVSSSPGSDQLARIEDKCARIEDKYARSEALLSRVEEKIEGATTRMSEAARQSDLAALRSEVRAVAGQDPPVARFRRAGADRGHHGRAHRGVDHRRTALPSRRASASALIVSSTTLKARMTAFRTLDDAGSLQGKRVLLRVDLNVPMEGERVTDATRIERIVPTIREIADGGGRVVLLAHFGRPKGKPVVADSLKQVVSALSQHLGRPVAFAEDCIGETASSAVSALKDGDVLLLEKHPLPHRRREERGRFRGGSRCQRRRLRQRGLLGRASRPCLDRGPRPCTAGLCRPADAGGARRPDQGARVADTAGHRSGRRRQGVVEDRSPAEPRRQGGHARHRWRHGQHLPARPRESRRQVLV